MTLAVSSLASSASGRFTTNTLGESLSSERISSASMFQLYPPSASGASGIDSMTVARLSKVFFRELFVPRSESRGCILATSSDVFGLNLASSSILFSLRNCFMVSTTWGTSIFCCTAPYLSFRVLVRTSMSPS